MGGTEQNIGAGEEGPWKGGSPVAISKARAASQCLIPGPRRVGEGAMEKDSGLGGISPSACLFFGGWTLGSLIKHMPLMSWKPGPWLAPEARETEPWLLLKQGDQRKQPCVIEAEGRVGSLTSEVISEQKEGRKEGGKEGGKEGKCISRLKMARRTFQAEGPASVKAGRGESMNQKFTGVEAEEAAESEVCSGDRVSVDSTSGCKTDKPALSWSSSA